MKFQSKIDAALTELMDKEPTKALPVLIEMSEQPEAPQTIDRNTEMEELALQSEASRKGVIEQLHQIGLPEDAIETFSIVNALAVALSADQIRTVAARDDVSFIRYNGQDNVAL